MTLGSLRQAPIRPADSSATRCYMSASSKVKEMMLNLNSNPLLRNGPFTMALGLYLADQGA